MSGSPTSLSTKATASSKETASSKAKAIPWLESTTPEPTPTPSPVQTPEPTPETSPEPSPEPTLELTPEPTEIPIFEAEQVPESTPEPVITEEDPFEVLAGSLLRVKINLSDTTAVEVQQEPPRPSWIQQLRALVVRR